MSVIPEISNPYLGSFIIGLIYGLGVCTASCLPYIAGYVAGTGAGFKKGVKITAFFNGGRILAYALIGALIGLVSGLVTLMAPEVLSPFQIYSSLIFGAVTIAIGASILLKARKLKQCTLEGTNVVTTGRMGRFGFDFGAFSLGLSRGLIICPPLISLLLLYALPFSNPLGTMSLAVLCGIGTTISPLLVLGGVTGWLLNKAPLFRKWISLAGGGILILLGVITIVTSITQLP
jgi:sulfite exporter TauE/SafE